MLIELLITSSIDRVGGRKIERYIYLYILQILMRKISLHTPDFVLQDEVIGFLERHVTRFGNGAKVDCPKKFLGKRVYLVVCHE